MSKYADFKKAEEALREAELEFKKYQEDPQVKRLVEFKEMAEALLVEYNVTKQDLLAVMGIVTPEPEVRSRKQIHRAMRRWTNPETGETYEGKNPAGKAKAWIEQFGVDNVKVETLE
ncbi:hypothetical protein N7645_15200 [Pseudomonas juntendi]|uniref:hypothetical protein n=1 Tax=Pseudomonas TaxID=286 RepID=UPI0012ADA03A|nr:MULTISPECIES: hypothetical protein [Pseudomonas]MDG9918235.1 hypothetical protein [Pseudomonas juntendi]MDH0507683.1 hypothetical protein [Pseudomonas juntendi]MDH1044835.1 hypothetical protein [Pseudomonas juntendi]MRT62350.1 hypothetical protein [Pseudomonas sp. CAH-1]